MTWLGRGIASGNVNQWSNMYENGKKEIVELSRLLPIEVIMERFKQGTSAVN